MMDQQLYLPPSQFPPLLSKKALDMPSTSTPGDNREQQDTILPTRNFGDLFNPTILNNVNPFNNNSVEPILIKQFEYDDRVPVVIWTKA